MAIITKNIHKNVSRYDSAGGRAAEAVNAAILFELSSAFTAAGVTTATTASKAKTVNSLTFTVLGQFFVKAGTDNFWTLGGATSNTTVAASSFQKYLLLIDTAGAASVQEGLQSVVNAASVGWTNISGTSAWAPFMTAVGSTKCVVGVITVATDATHTFIPGTTAFNGTGITTTYIDGIDQSLIPVLANVVGMVIGNSG